MQHPLFSIRKAGLTDIPLIRELTFQVWPQTYTSLLSPEQVDYMLELMYSEESLGKQIKEGAQFQVVYEGREPVGFSSHQHMGNGMYKLHKLYVLPSQQGKGTGRFMIDQILAEIKEKGATGLQLQVNRNNKAKYFYEKLGFRQVDEVKIAIGKGYFMDDYLMQIDA